MASVVTFSMFAPNLRIAKAYDGELVPLFKYGTQTPITLHNNQIQIPKDPAHQKRQFRSAWVSTVDNIDFPSKKGLTQDEFKAEFRKVLDDFEALNMNAVTVQVRPKLDAFYKSDINPWSEYLTGTQGKDPGWDPLPWMIEEAHSRNMEFHAWFNPYRVTNTYKPNDTIQQMLDTLAPNNWARLHPEYVVKFDGKLLLNPGEPAVMQYIADSIVEVVEKYDVDAIHFDDYFYPYKVTRNGVTYYFGDAGEDKATFEKYGTSFTDIKEWRRNNINTMISMVSNAIKAKKPYVKFGVSPFGIWGHYDNHPAGSPEGEGSHTPVTSSASYDDIYADTRKWAKEGTIDYITPQIYWAFGTTAAPYGELADWWANVVKGTNCQLYIGHANYKINSSDTDWKNPEEIGNQLKFNALYPEIKGSSFFSLKQLRLNNLGVTDKIKNEYFNTKALVPTMPWLDNKAPNKVGRVISTKAQDKGIELSWTDAADNDSTYYVIYRFEGKKLGDIEDPSNILATVRRTAGQTSFNYVDKTADSSKEYVYQITAVDRLHNESKPSVSFYPMALELQEKIMAKDSVNKTLDLEYRGVVQLADNYIVYQVINGKAFERSLSDVMVGAENIKVYLNSEEKIDIIVIDGKTPVNNMRIGLRSNVNDPSNPALLDYTQVDMKAADGFKLIDKKADRSFDIAADEQISFTVDKNTIQVTKNGIVLYRTDNRLYAVPANKDAKITIPSLKRGYGAPGYRGTIEITLSKDNTKLNLINEVQLDDYLLQVVPSEMPASFGLEALKAQAVAARTYALTDYYSSRFAERGFHVDDSTLSQVYNNSAENPTATQAVNETRGIIMKSGNELVDARYYSTSGGYSAAKHEVWSDPVTNKFPGTPLPYLIGKSYTYDPADNTKMLAIDTQNEKAIDDFYKNLSLISYDLDSAWFRWKVGLSKTEFENTVNKNLQIRYAADPLFILTKDESGNFISRPIPAEGIGQFKNMYVEKRGEGGNIMELVIEGTTGTYKIIKEFNIRFTIRPTKSDTLGSDVLLYRAPGGSSSYTGTLTNYSILPSAFFTFDIEKDVNNNIIGVTFYGGGNGHGVGMSQYGAKGLASKGATFTTILNTFYTNAKLVNVYDENSSTETKSLSLLISVAEKLYDSAVEGTKAGEYHKGSKAVFKAAIDKALGVLGDSNSDKAALDAAVVELKAAIDNFNAAKITEEQAAQFAREKAAIDAIAALPEIDKLTLEDEAAVAKARELVIAANNNANITNLDKLVAAETRIAELKKAAGDDKDSDNDMEKDKDKEGKLPKTGGMFDANAVAGLGLSLISIGTTIAYIKGRKGNK